MIPWIVRRGKVTSLERIERDIGTNFATFFTIGRSLIRHRGKPLPLREGEEILVVGWDMDSYIEGHFVVLPRRPAFFRQSSGRRMAVFGMLFIIVGGIALAKRQAGWGLLFTGMGAALIFNGLELVKGERLARSLARQAGG